MIDGFSLNIVRSYAVRMSAQMTMLTLASHQRTSVHRIALALTYTFHAFLRAGATSVSEKLFPLLHVGQRRKEENVSNICFLSHYPDWTAYDLFG